MTETLPLLIELQYLPPVSYFSTLLRHKQIHLEQHENYRKGSYRNRCYIATANGIQRLSIPLEQGKNQQQPIKEVKIAYKEPWQRQHWATLQSAYGNAPFFEHYDFYFAPFF